MGQAEHSVYLVVVNLRDLMGRHVLNVVVVPDQRVSICSALIGFLEPLCELPWIFLVKYELDSE